MNGPETATITYFPNRELSMSGSVQSGVRLLPRQMTGLSIVVLSATVIVLLLFARASGQLAPASALWPRLALVAGGWLAAVLFAHCRVFARTGTGWLDVAAAVMVAIFLAAMSPDVPGAVAAVSPVAIAVAACLMFIAGNGVTVQESDALSGVADQENTVNPALTSPSLPTSLPESSPVNLPHQSIEEEDVAGTDSAADESGDVWQAVQQQFASDRGLVQNIAGWASDEGEQTVVAHLRCEIPAQSRSTTVHVPIWPFLPSEPEVYCRIVDGPTAETRVVHARPNGVAVEVTLSDQRSCAQNTGLVVEIIAMARPDESSASAA